MQNLDYRTVDAFDLTPAMQTQFRREIETRGISRVQLEQADVLNLESLPGSWTNYDLIISASRLEYLPKRDLPRALSGVRARLARDSHILVIITRETPETKVFIECWWHAERYTKHDCLRRSAMQGTSMSVSKAPLALSLAEPLQLRRRGRRMTPDNVQQTSIQARVERGK